jgi:hypothetical protein
MAPSSFWMMVLNEKDNGPEWTEEQTQGYGIDKAPILFPNLAGQWTRAHPLVDCGEGEGADDGKMKG